MSRIRVAIAVADDALERTEDVLRVCRELGFLRDSSLTGVGVFTGSVEADSLGVLRGVPGVAAVELERGVRLHAPPRRRQ